MRWLAHPCHTDLQCLLWQVPTCVWGDRTSWMFLGVTETPRNTRFAPPIRVPLLAPTHHLSCAGSVWSCHICPVHQPPARLGCSRFSLCIFRIYFSSTMKTLSESMIEMELNLEINMEEMGIFMMSSLTSNDHSLSLHYCGLLQCFLIKSCQLLHKAACRSFAEFFFLAYLFLLLL